jgi:hypothetical protein
MLLAPRGGLANAHLERTAPLPSDASAQTHLRPASQSAWVRSPCTSRVIKNGRSGIRTHAGFRPHDFQSCALSHSAIRPVAPEGAPTMNRSNNGGSGMHRAARGGFAITRPGRIAPHLIARSARTHSASFCEARVGSKSQNLTAHVKRREWDSNPRGPFGPTP